MKYFLSTLIDQNLKDYFRDFKRDLSKFKRNLRFVPLDQMHFDYKYLGQDLSPSVIEYIYKSLEDFQSSRQFKSFSHPLTPLQFGKKSELSPNRIHTSLEASNELNQIMRIIHDVVKEIPEVKRSKDDNRQLGAIPVAKVTTNMNTDLRSKLAEAVAEAPPPPDILVNNLSVVSLRSVKGKPTFAPVIKVDLHEL
jgi:hypothetical protein